MCLDFKLFHWFEGFRGSYVVVHSLSLDLIDIWTWQDILKTENEIRICLVCDQKTPDVLHIKQLFFTVP